MTNEQIFRQIVQAFDTNQYQNFIELLAPDVEWHMLGDPVYRGKEAVSAMFTNPDADSMTTRSNRLIIDGNTAASTGISTFTDADGKVQTMDYCDVYELEGGKIKRMTSYVIDLKNKE